MYGVAIEGANLIKMSLVMAAVMLAIWLLAFAETTNTAEADSLPEDGKIAFNHDDALYTVEPDGSNPRQLLNDTYMVVGRAVWSPDGTKIAFSLSPEHEVFVINADAGRFSQGTISKFTNLTSNSASDEVPDWSPDGMKIAFASDRDGDYDIYTMDADGSDVAQVTNLPGNEYTPDWQPLTQKSRSMTVHQPDTGGPSLLFAASALLISGGVMFYAGLKRRM